MISSRGVSDVFTILDATMSRISDGKVVMFTRFIGSCGGGFCDLGMEEEEETECAELGT
jgi:hypothetical protein